MSFNDFHERNDHNEDFQQFISFQGQAPKQHNRQRISDAGAWLWNQISGFFGGIVDGIKDFF